MYIPRPFITWGFFALVSSILLQAGMPGQSFVMRTTEPVIVSNTLLAPGTHVWKLMDSSSNRNIVQISNAATNHVEAVILAIPQYRDVITGGNVVQFWETPAGFAKAVRAWFPPGDSYGQEFTYSKKTVLQFGRLNSVPAPESKVVPVVEALPETHAKAPIPSLVSAQTTEPVSQWPEGSWAVITDGVPGSPSAHPAAKQVKQTNGVWDALKRLPMTATLAPLIGLIGLGFLLLFVIGQLRRKDGKMPQPR